MPARLVRACLLNEQLMLVVPEGRQAGERGGRGMDGYGRGITIGG